MIKLKNKIRICFVWPKGFLSAYSIPLAFAFLKSNIDPELAEVYLIDCVLENIDSDSSAFQKKLKEINPDIVGVSSWSPMFPEAVSLMAAAKRFNPEITTIVGGPHASSYHEKVILYPEIDFLFRGESEQSLNYFLIEFSKDNPNWKLVPSICYLKGNEIIVNPQLFPELDKLKSPDYEFIQLTKYQKIGYQLNCSSVANAPLWITRGCPYRCQFCAAPDLNGKPLRHHEIETMAELIKKLYANGTRWFNIVDDNFTLNVEFAKDFCRMIIELDLKGIGFGTPSGIRMSRGDVELWSLMKMAGWQHLIVAPESGSQRTLELMKKDLDLDIVPRIIKDIRSVGLKVQAFFILGYPGEKAEDLKLTEEFILRCKFNFVFLANFQPLPGTPVYDELVTNGEIEDGLLPSEFTDGKVVYASKELKNFNFSKFVYKIYLKMLIYDPQNIPYFFKVLFRHHKLPFILKKAILNLTVMLLPNFRDKVSRPNVFRPLHEQLGKRPH